MLREAYHDHFSADAQRTEASRGRAAAGIKLPITRILVGMSIAEVIFSVALGLSTYMSPSSIEYLAFNVGNVQTCEFQGFLAQMGSCASALFSTSLSVFYLLAIKYNWSDRKLQSLEYWAHGGIWLVSFATAVFPIPLDLYNNAYHVCWINASPEGCFESETVSCERGGDYSLYATILTVLPLWPCLIASLWIMWSIYRFVSRLEARSILYGAASIYLTRPSGSEQRRSSDGKSAEEEEEDKASSDSNVPPSELSASPASANTTRRNTAASFRHQIDRQRSKAVANRAFLYASAFILTQLLRLLLTLAYAISEWYSEVAYVFAYDVMLPLQGFLNALVFVQHRTLKTPEGRLFKRVFVNVFIRKEQNRPQSESATN